MGPDECAAIVTEWHRCCRQSDITGATTGWRAGRATRLVRAVLADVDGEEGPTLETAVIDWVSGATALEVVVDQIRCLREVAGALLADGPSSSSMERRHRLSLVLDRVMTIAAREVAVRVREQVFVDPLTGLGNRRKLDHDIAREARHAERHRRLLTAVVLDVDGLKSVNDVQGHAAGDVLLRSLGAALASVLRADDMAYRMGGDEFALLLPETDGAGAHTLMDRVVGGGAPSFSWGMATYPGDCAASELVDLADRRMVDNRARRPGTRPVRRGVPSAADDGTARWPAHPVLGRLLQILVVVAPLAASLCAGLLTASLLPAPRGAVATVAWWLTVLVASGSVLLLAEEIARRLLPLAALLRLSMIFPDRAPSRFSVALRSGTVRQLEQRMATLRDSRRDVDASEAAGTILALAGALNAYDPRTRGHSERVRAFSDLVALELGLSADERDRLRWSALLHDIGKLSISHHILEKSGPLDDTEWEEVRRHPEEGARVAAPLRAWLGSWADTIAEHHERWDGEGYPRGLAGGSISLGARIVAVADAFEVMTSPRSYRRPVTVAAAREELVHEAGAQFDPAVVRAFLAVGLGRLRAVLGPLVWVAQVPLAARLQDAGRLAHAAMGGAVVAAVAGGLGVLPPPGETSTQVAGSRFESDAPSASVDELPAEDGSPPVLGVTLPPPPVEPGLPPLPEPLAGPPPSPEAPATAEVVSEPAVPSSGPPVPTGPAATPAPTTPPTVPPTTAPPPAVAPATAPPRVTFAAMDDLATGRRHATLVNVLANDVVGAAERRDLTVEVADGPDHGRARVVGGNRVLYVPDDTFTGSDEITYRVCEPGGLCDDAVARIVVASSPAGVR